MESPTPARLGKWNGKLSIYFIRTLNRLGIKIVNITGFLNDSEGQKMTDIIDKIFQEIYPSTSEYIGIDGFLSDENFSPDNIFAMEISSKLMEYYPSINTELNEQLFIIIEEALSMLLFDELKIIFIGKNNELSLLNSFYNCINNEPEAAYFSLLSFLTQQPIIDYFISKGYKGYISFKYRSENSIYVSSRPGINSA